jgi:hypothetical protein
MSSPSWYDRRYFAPPEPHPCRMCAYNHNTTIVFICGRCGAHALRRDMKFRPRLWSRWLCMTCINPEQTETTPLLHKTI